MRVLTSNSQPYRATLRAVTVGPKDTSLSMTRTEPPDATKCAKAQTPSSDTPTTSLSSVGSKRFRSIRRLLPVAAVLAAPLSPRASRMSTLRSGRRLAGAKAAFDCTNPAMSFFPFAATGKVGRSCLPQSCLNDLARLPRPLPRRRPCTSGSSQRSSITASRRNTSSLRGFRPAKRTRWLAVSADALARSAAPRSVQAGPPTTRMPEQDLPAPIPELRAGG